MSNMYCLTSMHQGRVLPGAGSGGGKGRGGGVWLYVVVLY